MSVQILSVLSILPWGFILVYLHPKNSVQRVVLLIIASLALGWLSTELVLAIHDFLWPDVPVMGQGKKPQGHILTQTAHIAFVQAGMMEEACKSILILGFSYLVSYNRKAKYFYSDVVLIGGFVALGFAGVENFQYISGANELERVPMFVGRTLKSTNAHLLINLCFVLFLLKSNLKAPSEKLFYLFRAFLLAVVQHGLFDFFVLPNARFGSWVATSLFVGIWVWVVKDYRKYTERFQFVSPENLGDGEGGKPNLSLENPSEV
ncbi:PrsW family intramembrane metalloprotease [Leptospira perolatii]|uniref:PrsW family intramembrane metalloprotease n=1 Tax=Leptospira perolatii TaxID=2023191 RepID=A0A2M9ZQH8_9LEPT|nr:PrsW family glutamic-type intramembrane protease [Leptospira perolatii]PJZ68258.1 PrsW family intramembrane metalloprotease [Leptospira perolatii]PJZ74183.1 PrsW family intramembrane metalloprotease [Leptospira perolatii]